MMQYRIEPYFGVIRDTQNVPYTAKLSRGKTFAVVHKTHHSLENFHGASGPCHYVLYTAMIQGENFHDWLENRESFPPRKFCRIRYCIADP